MFLNMLDLSKKIVQDPWKNDKFEIFEKKKNEFDLEYYYYACFWNEYFYWQIRKDQMTELIFYIL